MKLKCDEVIGFCNVILIDSLSLFNVNVFFIIVCFLKSYLKSKLYIVIYII